MMESVYIAIKCIKRAPLFYGRNFYGQMKASNMQGRIPIQSYCCYIHLIKQSFVNCFCIPSEVIL